jgi:hypothetical protein
MKMVRLEFRNRKGNFRWVVVDAEQALSVARSLLPLASTSIAVRSILPSGDTVLIAYIDEKGMYVP